MFSFISCQRATQLIEQRTDQALPGSEQTALWLHLRYCPYCRRYERHSLLINRLARGTAPRGTTGLGLSADARERLRWRLASATRDASGPDQENFSVPL